MVLGDEITMIVGVWTTDVKGNDTVVVAVDKMGLWKPTEDRGVVEAEKDEMKKGKVEDLAAATWSSWTFCSNF